jgi:hypothetical protein
MVLKRGIERRGCELYQALREGVSRIDIPNLSMKKLDISHLPKICSDGTARQGRVEEETGEISDHLLASPHSLA